MQYRLHLFFVLVFLSGPLCLANALTREDAITQDIQKRMENENKPEFFAGSEERIISRLFLEEFYTRREFRPAWDDINDPSSMAFELLNTLQKADREGLDPNDYHVDAIKNLMKEIQTKEENNKKIPTVLLTNLDLLLSDAFLSYGSHLLSGKINPYSIDDEWFAERRDANLPELLESAIENNNIRELLKSLLPTQFYYARLRVALDHYRTILKNGGWDKIPDGAGVKPGESDPRIVAVRQRLKDEGDLNQQPNDNPLLDEAVERGLISFQKRHGLEPDGALGSKTLAALNVSVENRIRQIELNMERSRWLPAHLGDRHILINIANFELDVIENGEPALNMRVVVGKRYLRTPVFSSTMTYIVINPTWTVPKKIAQKEIAAIAKRDPTYLIKENFKVFASYEDNAPLIDPSTIDWSQIDPKTCPFKFRQDAGNINALGHIKFIFPNRFDVYLHDTPSRHLFSRTIRDFSHGCIRIQKPVELAEFLLHINGEWTKEKIQAAINKGVEQFVQLPQPIPVHLMYWTAWVNQHGKVQFRDDIYGRDVPLDEALHGKPPTP
jgi:L,D-transpeptidase YcbB